MTLTDGLMHLKDAKRWNTELRELEARTKEVRAARDASIRAAIAPSTPERVTMYVAAKDLVMPQQTIARIRDRG